MNFEFIYKNVILLRPGSITAEVNLRAAPQKGQPMKKSWGLNPSHKIYYFSLLCFFLLGAFHFLGWPVTGLGDTDLWYHLSGGRYFARHHLIPDSGFFSFQAANREWTNYYWLFQLLVFYIHDLFAYQGLILLRSTMFLATAAAAAGFLLKKTRENQLLYFVLISMLYFSVLIPRFFAMVRPHMFSYFFIVMFIYLLENRSKYVLFLPLLAIIWCNLHGIEYPVMMLICFAYLAENLLNRIRNGAAMTKAEFLYVIPIVVAMWSVLINPHGISLLEVPFQPAAYQHAYIADMKKITLAELFNLRLLPIDESFTALSNIVLLLAFFGFVLAVVKRKMRLSHFLLMLGGLLLLARATRFRYEAVLLVLPIIKNYPLPSLAGLGEKLSGAGRVFIASLLLLVSFLFLTEIFANRPRYPFSAARLPEGVAAFLNHVGAGGTVLNIPSHGGYLQWQLHDNYKIFMDMQTILFKDTDYYLAENSFNDSEVLAKVIDSYRPGFITPLITNLQFRKIIKDFPDYTPVFFDDIEVVYIDKSRYPEIAARYELTAVDPFALSQLDINALQESATAAIGNELLKIHEIYPDGAKVNQVLALLYKKKGDIDKAMSHAEKIIRDFPESYRGYMTRADLFALRGLFNQAVQSYKKTLLRTDEQAKADIYKKLWYCYINLGQDKKAYGALRKSVDIFSPATGHEDLYRLGMLAFAVGKSREGIMLLELAQLKTPRHELDRVEKIRRLLQDAYGKL